MLIGLHGKAQSGKDTVFLTIQKLYPTATRLAFADKLKKSVARLFDISLSDVERLKTTTDVECRFVREVESTGITSAGVALPLNMRKILQRYGTEAHREVFGSDFWVDMLLPSTFRHAGKLFVVTDLRYENEARRIKQLGGHIVHVKRDAAAHTHDAHISEVELPSSLIDYTLLNDGTLITLTDQVRNMLFNFSYAEAV